MTEYELISILISIGAVGLSMWALISASAASKKANKIAKHQLSLNRKTRADTVADREKAQVAANAEAAEVHRHEEWAKIAQPRVVPTFDQNAIQFSSMGEHQATDIEILVTARDFWTTLDIRPGSPMKGVEIEGQVIRIDQMSNAGPLFLLSDESVAALREGGEWSASWSDGRETRQTGGPWEIIDETTTGHFVEVEEVELPPEDKAG